MDYKKKSQAHIYAARVAAGMQVSPALLSFFSSFPIDLKHMSGIQFPCQLILTGQDSQIFGSKELFSVDSGSGTRIMSR